MEVWINGIFKMQKVSSSFQINPEHDICAADKTIDASHTASTDCNY